MIDFNKVYTSEAKLMSDAKTWLEPQERSGIKTMRICDRYAKGYSDLFLCVGGIFVAAELKDNKGKPSPHQLMFIDDINSCGGIAGICRNLQDIADLIKQAERRMGEYE